ncbi:MAG TPA: toll/interleukin-1 receptor domain-containing protein [Puia sp.]|jgi:hypothetical protein
MVFLSYAREGIRYAEKLYLDLRLEEIDIGMDVKCLLPGQNWKKEITNAIRTCNFFIMLISRHSINKRGYVQKEVKIALDVPDKISTGQIFLIPVRLEDITPVDDELLNLNWVNLYESYPKGVNSVLSALSDAGKLPKTDYWHHRVSSQAV